MIKKGLLAFLMCFLSLTVFPQSGIISIPTIYTVGQIMPGTVTPLTINEFGFEIWLKNNGSTVWAYNAGQYGVNFNSAIINGGTLSIVQLASGLGSKQPPLLEVKSSPDRFRFAQNTFGDGGPFVNPGDSVLVSRVKVTNTVPFPASTANLELRTVNPDRCAVFRYTGGVPAGTGNFGTAILLNTTLVTYFDAVLPIELNSLTSIAKGRDVVLNWETKSEVNSSKFEIERASSSTAPSWVKVGEVAAAGNSNSVKQYSFTDKKLNSGKYSYRLKMLDADGSYRYSDVVEAEVSLPKEYAISQNYPNPFNPTTRIDYQLPFDSKVTIELYGITGEKVATLINSEQSAGYYTAEVNASALNLASGVYIYRMNANNTSGQNFVQVKKLMLTK